MNKNRYIKNSSKIGYEIIFNKRDRKEIDERKTIERIQMIKKQLYGSNASVERILKRTPAEVLRAYIIQHMTTQTAKTRKKRRS